MATSLLAGPLVAGAILGLSIAAPFGPVSLVCVQKSLNSGHRHGIVAGFGAATAHGIFATAAIASAGAASAILAPWSSAVRLISALILVTLGIRTIMRAGSTTSRPATASIGTTYASLMLLSLSNPMTIIPYLAVATVSESTAAAGTLTLWSVPGVLFATASWYTGLSVVAAMLRRGIAASTGYFLNVVAGGALVVFGAFVEHDLLGF